MGAPRELNRVFGGFWPGQVPGNGEVLNCADVAAHPLLGSITEIDPLAAGRPVLKVWSGYGTKPRASVQA